MRQVHQTEIALIHTLKIKLKVGPGGRLTKLTKLIVFSHTMPIVTV